jgi:uncharacterized protein (UPF0332 family)
MAETRLEEARELIAISRRELQEMEHLRSFDLYYGAINRAYYAMFHAVSALLFVDGKEFSKHMALISHFGQHYAKTGKAPQHFHHLLLDAFRLRQKVDYDFRATVTKERANDLCASAREIVDFMDNAVAARAQDLSAKE